MMMLMMMTLFVLLIVIIDETKRMAQSQKGNTNIENQRVTLERLSIQERRGEFILLCISGKIKQ